MKISGLKLAFYVSLLVHATAFSLIYTVQWASLSAPVSDARADADLLEITVEPQFSMAFSGPVPSPAPEAPSMPASMPIKSMSLESEAVPEVNISESLASVWDQELKISEVSVAYPDSGVTANSTVENQNHGDSTGVRSGVQYLLNPKPIYPRESRKRKEQGTVILEVLVTTDGCPREICVKRSAGYSLLDEAALRAVSQWRFAPAQQDSVKVASQVEIPVRFELLDSL